MKKRLQAKTQKINPTLPQYASSFSRAFTMEPEGTETDKQELLLKKGLVFAILTMEGTVNYDTGLVLKVVQDTLTNSYYHSENISPIQSLEKAIVEVRDKVLQLPAESIVQNQGETIFSLLTGVLWGNVLYVVQYGDGESFLMREGSIKPITSMHEGNFGATSGMVKEDDVVILCSKSFGEEYPPAKLLSKTVSESDLQTAQSCLLMRLLVDLTFTEQENVNFGIEREVSKPKKSDFAEKIAFLNSAADNVKEKGYTQIGIASKSLEKLKKVKINKDLAYKLVLPGTALILALSIFISIYNKDQKKVTPPKDTQETQEVTLNQELTKPIEQVKANTQMTTDNPAEDDKNKIKRVIPEVFYDIKITDSTAIPTEIAAFSKYVVVADKENGKLFVSQRETPKFEAKPGIYLGIRSLHNNNNKLNFADNQGYKIYDLEVSKVSDNYILEDFNQVYSYLNFIYTLKENQILRYNKSDTTKNILWGQDTNFINAKSMAISYSIYILSSEGQLLKYTSGEKDDFFVQGLNGDLKGAVKIAANPDLDNIYIADATNKRIVVLDEKGNVKTQYLATNPDYFNDLKSIDVTPDEKTLFVLNSSKVYRIDL